MAVDRAKGGVRNSGFFVHVINEWLPSQVWQLFINWSLKSVLSVLFKTERMKSNCNAKCILGYLLEKKVTKYLRQKNYSSLGKFTQNIRCDLHLIQTAVGWHFNSTIPRKHYPVRFANIDSTIMYQIISNHLLKF